MENNMKKVLIIRYEGNPFFIRMSKEIETIRKIGCEIDLLIPCDSVGNVNILREFNRDPEVYVNLHFFSKSKNKFCKIFNNELYDKHFIKKLTSLILTHQYQYIIVKDTGCLYNVFRALKKSASKIPVICSMYENSVPMLKDYSIHLNIFSKLFYKMTNYIQRLEKIEKKYLNLCEHTIVVIEEAKQYLIEKYNIPQDKISILYNVEILEDFDSITPQKIKTSKPIISYVGSLGKHRGIEFVLDCLSKYQKKNYHMFIVGATKSRKLELDKILHENKLTNEVTILEYLSHKEAMGWIKASSIGLIPHIDSIFIKTTIPNKLFQYMAASVACIVSNVGPLERIIVEETCGKSFRFNDVNNFLQTLDELLEAPEKRKKMGDHGRIATVNKYNWEMQSEVYKRLL